MSVEPFFKIEQGGYDVQGEVADSFGVEQYDDRSCVCAFHCFCRMRYDLCSGLSTVQKNYTCLTHSRRLKYYLGTTVALSALGCVVVSVPLLMNVIDQYVGTCIKELNGPWNRLVSCQKPFVSKISAYQGVLAAGTFVLGFFLQKFCEPSKNEKLGDPIEFKRENFLLLFKKLVAYFEASLNYESQVFLGFLYNGVWLNTKTLDTWVVYFHLQSAAIGIAGAFLGMYIQTQLRAVSEMTGVVEREEIDPRPSMARRIGVPLVMGSIGVGLISLSYSSIVQDWVDAKPKQIARDLVYLLFGRYAWKAASKRIYKKIQGVQSSELECVVQVAKGALKYLSPLVVVSGYFLYASEPAAFLKPLGMFTIGVGVGSRSFRNQLDFKEIEWEPVQLNQDISNRFKQSLANLKTITRLAWKPLLIIGFGVALQELKFLDCFSKKHDVCPISFEYSKNYINFSSSGIVTFLFSSVASYYIARTFRYLQYRSSGRVESIFKKINYIKYDYQFDLLSLVPYTIFQSGRYIESFKAYATYNPMVTIFLLAMTYGFYREKTNALGSDPNKPIFTDTGSVTALV